MTLFPPPDYVQTDSAVSGIIVYRPRPPEEAHQPVVVFHCPQCDATTAYSAENGGLTCTHCGYHEPPPQPVVGKAAAAFEFTVETMARAAHGWGVARSELECQRCGAHTTRSADMLSHTCPFCGSNQVMQAKAPQEVLRPRFLVPLTVTEEDCRRVTADWLRSSWMVPADLQRLARSAEFAPVYLPFWTFDAQASAAWRAEVAHTRTKSVYVNGKHTTRTVTEWRWESGQVELFHDDVLVYGGEQVSRALLRQMRGFQLDALVPYDPSFLAGVSAQAYDVGLDAAWELGRSAMRQRTKTACQQQASSRQMRSFSMSLDFSQETWRHILLPVYLATYPYRGQTYQVLINGQTGAIAGQRPVDWRKVMLAAAAALLPGLLLALLALYLSAQPGNQAGGLAGFAAVLAVIAALLFIIRAVQVGVAMGKA